MKQLKSALATLWIGLSNVLCGLNSRRAVFSKGHFHDKTLVSRSAPNYNLSAQFRGKSYRPLRSSRERSRSTSSKTHLAGIARGSFISCLRTKKYPPSLRVFTVHLKPAECHIRNMLIILIVYEATSFWHQKLESWLSTWYPNWGLLIINEKKVYTRIHCTIYATPLKRTCSVRSFKDTRTRVVTA